MGSDSQILILKLLVLGPFVECKPNPASLGKRDLVGFPGEKYIKKNVRGTREEAVKILQSFPQMNSQKTGAKWGAVLLSAGDGATGPVSRWDNFS